MLLGLSGLECDEQIDPAQIHDGAGVPHGRELIGFVDAVTVGGDGAAAARDRLADDLGPDAMVDAAAVVANFFMMTRLADGTGTPLDEGSEAISRELRADLGIDTYASKRLVS